MNQAADNQVDIEPERYELREDLPYRFELDRRDFLKSFGGGLLVLYLLDSADAQEPGQPRRRGFGRGGGQGVPQDIAAWLHIGEDDQITVYTGKAEVGQNIRTSLTQVVAEELNTPSARSSWSWPTRSYTPFDMGTFGSMTTPRMSPRSAAHGCHCPRDAHRPRGRDLENRPIASSPPPTAGSPTPRPEKASNSAS